MRSFYSTATSDPRSSDNQNLRLTVEGIPRRVRRREHEPAALMDGQIENEEDSDDEEFLITISNVVLGPSWPRSYLQTEHFKHNMQRMHMLFR